MRGRERERGGGGGGEIERERQREIESERKESMVHCLWLSMRVYTAHVTKHIVSSLPSRPPAPFKRQRLKSRDAVFKAQLDHLRLYKYGLVC